TMVWREGAADWRPLSQVLETGELHADLAMVETVTVAPRPSPAAGLSVPGPAPAPAEPIAPADAPKPAPPSPRARPTAPPRTARRPRPSPWLILRIVIPLVILAAFVAAGFFWWKAGEPARERQRSEAEIRSFSVPDRHLADEGLGLRLDLPE